MPALRFSGSPLMKALGRVLKLRRVEFDEVTILGRDREDLFYPVVRQHSSCMTAVSSPSIRSETPKPDIPDRFLVSTLNQHAFAREDDPEKSRFGASARPAQLAVLGAPALLFDNEGKLTLFWQDSRVSTRGRFHDRTRGSAAPCRKTFSDGITLKLY